MCLQTNSTILNQKSHIIKKTNQSESKHSTLQTKSVRPEPKTVTSTHTNNQNSTVCNYQNVCTQTDDSLLFDLIKDFMAKETMHRNMVASSVKRTAKMTAKPSVPLSQPKNTVRASLTRHSNIKPSVSRKK